MSDVRGWLNDAEAAKLRKLAAGKVVLEVGTYCGKSTLAMAATAERVYTVDWHRGDASTQLNEKLSGWGTEDTLAEFWQNIKAANASNVFPLVGRTGQVLPILGEGWADVAFVDGAHDTPSASLDIILAKRCVKPGGVIVLHDWDRESVRAAAAMHFHEQPQIDGDRLAWFTNDRERLTMKTEQATGITSDDLAQQIAGLDQQMAAAQQARRTAEDTIAGIQGATAMVRHLAAKLSMKEMTAATEADQLADGRPPE